MQKLDSASLIKRRPASQKQPLKSNLFAAPLSRKDFVWLIPRQTTPRTNGNDTESNPIVPLPFALLKGCSSAHTRMRHVINKSDFWLETRASSTGKFQLIFSSRRSQLSISEKQLEKKP